MKKAILFLSLILVLGFRSFGQEETIPAPLAEENPFHPPATFAS